MRTPMSDARAGRMGWHRMHATTKPSAKLVCNVNGCFMTMSPDGKVLQKLCERLEGADA